MQLYVLTPFGASCTRKPLSFGTLSRFVQGSHGYARSQEEPTYLFKFSTYVTVCFLSPPDVQFGSPCFPGIEDH